MLPTTFSYGSNVLISGTGFAPAASSNTVRVGDVVGDVISANSTQIIVRHLTPVALGAAASTSLAVSAGNQVSNTLPVTIVPRGSSVSIPIDTPTGVRGMVPLGDGTLALFVPTRVLDVTADGDIAPFYATLGTNGFAPADRPDGIYYLTATAVRRFLLNAPDVIFQPLPAGTPTGMAFDTTGNLYVAIAGATTTTIERRDYVTGAITTFPAVAGTTLTSLVAIGTQLYAADATLGAIRQFTVATGVEGANLAAVGAVTSMTTDGTLLFYADATGVHTVNAAGAIASYSTRTTGGPVDEIARNAGGVLFVRTGDRIWRLPDATHFTSYVAPLTPPLAVGASGLLYAGSTATCQVGSSLGGVFYEIHTDGTLRHVLSDFCDHTGGLPSAAGQFYVPADVGGAVNLIDPVGGFEMPVIPGGTIVNPRFVAIDNQGSLFVPNDDGLGGVRISKFDSFGNVVSLDFMPAYTEAPTAGAVYGSNLALVFPTAHEIRIAPTATGGASVPFGPPGFQPTLLGMTSTLDGRLLISDTDGALWSLAADGNATLLGANSGDGAWFISYDASYDSVGPNSIDLVMP